MHDAQVGGAFVDATEVAADRGLEEGVDGGGACSLVLAVLGQYLVRGADGESGVPQRCRDPSLVLRSQVGEEQADGDRLSSERPGFIDDARDFGIVEWGHDLPVRAHPLPHGDDVATGDDVGTAARFEVVEGGALLPADDEQVAEALGGDEHGAGAAAFEEGVGRDRAAVRQASCGQIAGSRKDRLFRGGRCREAFPCADAALLDGDEVGECAAHVHPEDASVRLSHG